MPIDVTNHSRCSTSTPLGALAALPTSPLPACPAPMSLASVDAHDGWEAAKEGLSTMGGSILEAVAQTDQTAQIHDVTHVVVQKPTSQAQAQTQTRVEPTGQVSAPTVPSVSDAASFDGRQVQALRQAGVPELHIQVALQRQRLTHEPLTEIMRPAEYGFLTPERLARVHAHMAGLDYFGPTDLDTLDAAQLQTLGQHLQAKAIGIQSMQPLLPVSLHCQELTLLCAEPRDAIKAQQLYPGFRHRVVVGSERTLQTLYRHHFAHSGEDAMALYRTLKTLKVDDDGADQVLRNFVMSLLRHGCYLGASDIALCPTVGASGGGVVRYKVGGAGTVFTYLEPSIWQRVITHILNHCGASEEVKKAPVDARWEFTEADRELYQEIMHRYSFRVAILQRRASEHMGVTVVMRILDQQSEASDLDALGFDADTLHALRQAKDRATGLLLVTGPTGSGKTTTLYALLNEIDPVTRWVESIENPIEYAKGVWMQFQTRTGGDEASAAQSILKGLLRAAPDVILFGEIRKADIARELMDAANTGHLVFGTFHTNDAASTISRLKGFNVDLDMLASLLVGILAQRLVRTLCNSCKVPDTRPKTQEALANLSFLQRLSAQGGGKPAQPGYQPYQAVGCPNCNHTGYRGRRMVYELLKVTPAVQDLIEQGASPRRIALEGVAEERSLAANAMRLVAQGLTSIEEAQRLAEGPATSKQDD